MTEENKKNNPEEETSVKEEEIPEKFKDLVEKIEKLNVADLAKLVEVLEKKFGVSPMMAAAPAAGAQGGSEGQGAEGGEEKSSFDIEIKDAGAQKIAVVKLVKEITGKGLREAKELVDGAPKVIKEGVKKEEAEEIKQKLEEAGATVELK
jgi:large subunit ribosomal protein L7/L12